LISRIFDKINLLKDSSNLNSISWVKKLVWYKLLYRIRIGNYRMWFSYNNWEIVLQRFLHRKDIYKKYPD
jgi:mRNA interferase RelE/StbE